MPTMAESIAKVVQAEIERQQDNADYDSMNENELADVINRMQEKLDLCKAQLAARRNKSGGANDKAAEAPKMTARKASGAFPDLPWTKPDGTVDAEKVRAYMTEEMSRRIMVLDGAMGTAIQEYKFNEQDFRMEMFKDHKVEIKGNNDLLCFTQVRALVNACSSLPSPLLVLTSR